MLTAGVADSENVSPWFEMVRHGTCAQCALTASRIPVTELGGNIAEEAELWFRVLWRGDADVLRRRPKPAVWSPLEYACHVRDTIALFADRVEQVMTEEHPQFAYQDQDRAAADGRYNEQPPITVATALVANARRLQRLLAGLSAETWERTGTRLAGEIFDVALLARFALHEARHHRLDATGRSVKRGL